MGREKQRECGPGALPLLGSRVGPVVSQVHPLGSENVGEKSRVTQMVSYLGEPALSKRGTSWVGHFGSLSSCVVGNVFIGEGCL